MPTEDFRVPALANDVAVVRRQDFGRGFVDAVEVMKIPDALSFLDRVAARDERLKMVNQKLLAGTDPSSLDKPFLDFRKWPLAGATAPEKYLLRIRIKGKYPHRKH